MSKILFNITYVFLFALLVSCDKGIEPYPEPLDPENTGFSGTISFKGEWPEGIARTHLVLFKEKIVDSTDFFPPNLSYVSNDIDSGTVTLEYNSKENNLLGVEISPGTYEYLVVAQSTKEELSLNRSDWFVIGVFYSGNNTSQPGKLVVQEGRMTSNVDIFCDFDNPPPQPPGGSQ